MTLDRRHRLSVLSRIAAGFGGGYVLTSLVVGFLALCLPGSRASAVLSATMPGFLLYALIVMGAFHARTAFRAWIWIASGAASFTMLIALITSGGPHG